MEPIEMNKFLNATIHFTDERSFVLKLSPTWTWIAWIWINISLLVGWIAKYYIYMHIFSTKVKDQPINILILINQINNHICGTIALASLSFSLALQISVKEFAEEFLGGFMTGSSYCWFFYYAVGLNTVYQGVDGIGISVIRFLYIKKGTWIKYTFGEIKLLLIIMLLNTTVATLEMYLYNIEVSPSRSMYNICMGTTSNYQTVLLDYIQAGMKISFNMEKPFWIPFSGAFGLFLGVAELYSYFYLFVYLYKHNKSLHILPEETKVSRNNFNAQTMMGQFYLYITDTAYIVFLTLAGISGPKTLQPETKDLIVFVKQTEFGFLAILHCLLIPQLRRVILKAVNIKYESFLLKSR